MEIKVSGNVRIDIPAIDRLIGVLVKDAGKVPAPEEAAPIEEAVTSEPVEVVHAAEGKPDYSHYSMFQDMLKAADELLSVAPEKVGDILHRYTETGAYSDVPPKDWGNVIKDFKEAAKKPKKVVPSIEDIRKAGRDYIMKNDKEKMQALLKDFEVTNISSLAPAQYEDFMKALWEEM